jgi:hypothetical protein
MYKFIVSHSDNYQSLFDGFNDTQMYCLWSNLLLNMYMLIPISHKQLISQLVLSLGVAVVLYIYGTTVHVKLHIHSLIPRAIALLTFKFFT